MKKVSGDKMSRSYNESVKIERTLKLREILKELPRFAAEFFNGTAERTLPRTKVAYALDLRVFFRFLKEEIPYFMEKEIWSLEISDLEVINVDILEQYAEYLSYYVKNIEIEQGVVEKGYSNEELGKSRKLSALRSMFSYFYKKQKLSKNVTCQLPLPKIHQKNITTLDVDEVAKLLDETESGGKLSERQQKYHEHTKTRDLAIMTLLLGTGMRISELVGMDLDDVDFNHRILKILRKGGDEAILYFGDEVYDALSAYLAERKEINPRPGHETAFFLSLQNKRLTDRAIQNLVKKYTRTVTTIKNISPHKLRSTYGTNLYRETRDIYLVAEVLGHADVNTTKKHYAKIDEDLRRSAANIVKLREN